MGLLIRNAPPESLAIKSLRSSFLTAFYTLLAFTVSTPKMQAAFALNSAP